MCGRYALATEKKILEMLYQLIIRDDFELRPRYNISPSQQIAVCRLSPQNGKKELAALKWGLVPLWAEDQSIGSRMINARSETAASKPSFRDAFKKRRILIPVSGFYEWKQEEEGLKQPYFIQRLDGQPFSLAGLWERWEKGAAPLESCTILTTEPNTIIAPLHSRMPVIIAPEHYDLWLDLSTDPAALTALLAPYAPAELTANPVSRLVNSPSNDSPELIESTD